MLRIDNVCHRRYRWPGGPTLTFHSLPSLSSLCNRRSSMEDTTQPAKSFVKRCVCWRSTRKHAPHSYRRSTRNWAGDWLPWIAVRVLTLPPCVLACNGSRETAGSGAHDGYVPTITYLINRFVSGHGFQPCRSSANKRTWALAPDGAGFAGAGAKAPTLSTPCLARLKSCPDTNRTDS